MGNNLSPYTNVNGYSWDCWIDFGELRGDFFEPIFKQAVG
jgi:hypothetical protein